jgi:transposase-like protein
VKEKRIQKKYEEEFKRQAVEMVIHSGKTQAQIARELGVSGYSLNLWKKTYLKRMEPAQLGSRQWRARAIPLKPSKVRPAHS